MGKLALEIGDVFNPYKMFVGSFVPNWIIERRDLTPIDKLVWAKLAQHSGKQGKCFPAQAIIAKEIGSNTDTVNKSINRLCKVKLIKKISPDGWKRLAHRNCEYEFILDEILLSRISDSINPESHNRSNPHSLYLRESCLREYLKTVTSADASRSALVSVTKISPGGEEQRDQSGIKATGNDGREVGGEAKSKRGGGVGGRERVDVDGLFEELWELYPKKVKRKAAVTKFKDLWEKGRIHKEGWTGILEGLKKQTCSENWTKEGGRWIPYLENWLRDERWNDLVKESPACLQNENPEYKKTKSYWDEAEKTKMTKLKQEGK